MEKARREELDVLILGGGSNLLVADEGVDALVLTLENRGIECLERGAQTAVLRVGAGCVWDDFVDYAVHEGLAGIDCLSGIPGYMGAAPIQNIGAYGQEVAQVIESVICISKADGSRTEFPREACGFGYRTSHFKHGHLRDQIVTQVVLRLSFEPPEPPRYPELGRACGSNCQDLSLLRETVIGLRRKKSMIYDPEDPNHRSAGSFFVNPVVDSEQVAALRLALDRLGIDHGKIPCFDQADGQLKLSAAWLMERAGFKKGFGDGAAGLSTNHCLAVVNRGKATSQEIHELVNTIQEGVRLCLGIDLVPEPVFWGGRG